MSNDDNIFLMHLPLEFSCLEKVCQGAKAFIKGLEFRTGAKIEVQIDVACVPAKIRHKVFKSGSGGPIVC